MPKFVRAERVSLDGQPGLEEPRHRPCARQKKIRALLDAVIPDLHVLNHNFPPLFTPIRSFPFVISDDKWKTILSRPA